MRHCNLPMSAAGIGLPPSSGVCKHFFPACAIRQTGHKKKLNTYLEFSELLDMGPFMENTGERCVTQTLVCARGIQSPFWEQRPQLACMRACVYTARLSQFFLPPLGLGVLS